MDLLITKYKFIKKETSQYPTILKFRIVQLIQNPVNHKIL
jgi:hypothetical protein